MPDLVTTFPLRGLERARARPRFFSAEARFRPTEGEHDDVTLWGVASVGED